MSEEFNLGFLIGSLVVGVVVAPLLTYFGMVYFNLRKMEKRLIKDAPKEVIPKVDDDTLEALREADKLLKNNVI